MDKEIALDIKWDLVSDIEAKEGLLRKKSYWKVTGFDYESYEWQPKQRPSNKESKKATRSVKKTKE